MEQFETVPGRPDRTPTEPFDLSGMEPAQIVSLHRCLYSDDPAIISAEYDFDQLPTLLSDGFARGFRRLFDEQPEVAKTTFGLLATSASAEERLTAACMLDRLVAIDRETTMTVAKPLVHDSHELVNEAARGRVEQAVENGALSADDLAYLLRSDEVDE